MEKSRLKSKVQSFKTPSGRCSVKKFKKVTIIDDSYNANLNSCLGALNYLNAFSGGKRKIFVFGDMYELGDKSIEQHKLIGEQCTNLKFDGVFTIGNETINTNSALDKSIIHEHFRSRKEMIVALKNFIEPGDIVLFKGSRLMKMENIIDGVFTI
jgi:UDP-N-acetylmuramoyl-tripeptide--D-alanyl-D-alanine ligase